MAFSWGTAFLVESRVIPGRHWGGESGESVASKAGLHLAGTLPFGKVQAGKEMLQSNPETGAGPVRTFNFQRDGGWMHILVVEDDRKIAAFIERGFRQEGYAVDSADNGVDGFHRAMSEVYDAAVIDVMLPRLNGLDLIQDLRREGNLTPVLILSARNSVDDRIKGLQAGGDDYLVKPFSFAELLARLQALVRRAKAVAEPTALSVLDLQLDLVRRTAVRAGRTIDLQPREFALLEYLVRNQGKVVSKTMIMDQVWGYDFDPSTNVVESRISRLRDKVDRGFDHPLIRTIRGAGYAIRENS
jgi:DNA-binding response OmpR family regulator